MSRFGLMINTTSHYLNWQVVATVSSEVAGGFNGCMLPSKSNSASSQVSCSKVLEPLNELKVVAGGSWYIAAIAIFPKFRGRGFGQSLLQKAELHARLTNAKYLTLMVGSFNRGAHQLYKRAGFEEWESRPFSIVPGSDQEGESIQMYKVL